MYDFNQLSYFSLKCIHKDLLFSYTRGQFEEMCADILARVEAPLQSLLEHASECYCTLLLCASLYLTFLVITF